MFNDKITYYIQNVASLVGQKIFRRVKKSKEQSGAVLYLRDWERGGNGQIPFYLKNFQGFVCTRPN